MHCPLNNYLDYSQGIIKNVHTSTVIRNGPQLLMRGLNQNHLYLILKGSVSIILREDDDREIVVAYLNPGDFFGEMGPISSKSTTYCRSTYS